MCPPIVPYRPKTLEALIQAFDILGAFHASKAIKSALADRIA